MQKHIIRRAVAAATASLALAGIAGPAAAQPGNGPCLFVGGAEAGIGGVKTDSRTGYYTNCPWGPDNPPDGGSVIYL